ncbi:MAG: DUF4097 family beta strand repeat-containing protein [Candidatus Faecivicinus sp.]
MNKEQFMLELDRRLSGLALGDRKVIEDYFIEMIDDRMEDGLTEEEAVDALGDVDQIILETMPESGTSAPAASGECMHFFEPIHTLAIDCAGENIFVETTDRMNGETGRIDLSDSKDCSCLLQNGVLTIRSEPRRFRTLFHLSGSRSSGTIRLTLARRPLESAQIHTLDGGISVDGLNLSGAFKADSASGDLELKDVQSIRLHAKSAGGDLFIHSVDCQEIALETAGGDLELQNACCSQVLSVQTRSGDLMLQDVSCAELQAHCASGDAQLTQLKADKAIVVSASGDLDLEALQIKGSLNLRASSGDIQLRSASAKNASLQTSSGDLHLSGVDVCRILLSTSNGDISGDLAGSTSQYTFRAHSQSGDVWVPDSCGERIVEAWTSCGDINLQAQ